MRHRLWLCFKLNITSVMYCPTTEVLKPGAKTRWGFSQEICCERPPEIQWKAAPWNRGIAESPSKSWGYHGIYWGYHGIYWEYHSATLGLKDVPNISPIHVFTHLHVFFLIVQWFTRFWNDAPCFFMDAPSPHICCHPMVPAVPVA